MLLIDTSVWIGVFRDRTGQVRQKLETLINERDVFLTRFTQLELLQRIERKLVIAGACERSLEISVKPAS